MSNDSQDILNIGAAIKTTWSFGFECFFLWKYYIVPSLCRIQYIKYCHSVEENNCSHFKANEGDNDWMSKGLYSHLFRLMHVYRTLWYFFISLYGDRVGNGMRSGPLFGLKPGTLWLCIPRQQCSFYSVFSGLSVGVGACNSERQHAINILSTVETEGVFENLFLPVFIAA